MFEFKISVLLIVLVVSGVENVRGNAMALSKSDSFTPLTISDRKINKTDKLEVTNGESKITEPPIVNLPELGRLKGSTTLGAFTQKTIYQFLGVNYAESPSGPHRFKAPIPVKPWTDIKNATKYGRSCPILKELMKLSHEQLQNEDLEDCLNLCAYSGDLNITKNAPVMLWVHGGGLYEGSGSWYPPNYLLEENIVLVVPQYRLDALGFLSTLSDDIPGNAGLLDIMLALEWVHKNIKFFGGNPNQVTVFGQSAGGVLVSALTLSPEVPTHLFQKVIIQSGTAMGTWSFDLNPERNAYDIATRAGVNISNMGLGELNESFMKMDVMKLLAATKQHEEKGTLNGINTVGGRRLVINGPTKLFSKTPYATIKGGQYRKDLAMMVGSTKHDGSYVVALIYDILQVNGLLNNQTFMKFDLIDFASKIMGMQDDTSTISGLASSLYWNKNQLMSGDMKQLLNGLIDFISVIAFKGPSLRCAQTNARFNPNNTYLYTFDYRGEYTRFGYGEDTSGYPFDGGVHHSNDYIYLYPYPPKVSKLNPQDLEMAKQMVHLWTSFASHGQPEIIQKNAKASKWLPLTEITGPYLHIDKEISLGDSYIDEFTVTTREANSGRLAGLTVHSFIPITLLIISINKFYFS